MNIEQEIKQLGPWICDFEIQGHKTGGYFDALNDRRILVWLSKYPQLKTVLEMGSLEGGHTAAIASYPGILRVVGLEARDANLAKCEFVHKSLGITNSIHTKYDLEQANLMQLGSFDGIFCSGVLYHMLDPVRLFNQFNDITDIVFLGTHYVEKAVTNLDGWEGEWKPEFGMKDVLSGVEDKAFWLTKQSIEGLAKVNGFKITFMETVDTKNGLWLNAHLESKE